MLTPRLFCAGRLAAGVVTGPDRQRQSARAATIAPTASGQSSQALPAAARSCPAEAKKAFCHGCPAPLATSHLTRHLPRHQAVGNRDPATAAPVDRCIDTAP